MKDLYREQSKSFHNTIIIFLDITYFTIKTV